MKLLPIVNYFKNEMYLSEQDVGLLRNRLVYRELKTRDFLLQPGEICKHLYFVVEGYLGVFEQDEDGLQIIDFAGPGNFCTAPVSFFDQSVSEIGIIATNHVKLISLSYLDWASLCDTSHQLSLLSNRISNNFVKFFFEEFRSRRQRSALINYKSLLKRFPKIGSSIYGKYIASFLGIQATAFSRLRNKLNLEERNSRKS